MPLARPSFAAEDASSNAALPLVAGAKRRPLRVALVGASGYAKAHLRMIAMGSGEGLFQLVGAAVINQGDEPERCQEIRKLGGLLFPDFDSMIAELAGELDLCFIPTGIHHHASMTIAALKAGANVLVEKPIAATIQEVEAIRQCVEETGRFIAVGFQSIYDPATRWLKEAILSGGIGKVRTIRSRAMWPRSSVYYARNDWAGRLKVENAWVLDSPFNNALAHQLNLMCFLAGSDVNASARPISVQSELYRTRDIESADTACLRIRTSTDISLYNYVSHSCVETLNPWVEVIGDAGIASWSLDQVTIQPQGATVQTKACLDFNRLLKCVGSQVFARVTDAEAPVCSLDNAEAHTLCVNGAHESAAIRDIPQQYLTTHQQAGGESQIAINDLSTYMSQVFDQEKLFSEIGVPWASPGKEISMLEYRQFPSRRLPQ